MGEEKMFKKIVVTAFAALLSGTNLAAQDEERPEWADRDTPVCLSETGVEVVGDQDNLMFRGSSAIRVAVLRANVAFTEAVVTLREELDSISAKRSISMALSWKIVGLRRTDSWMSDGSDFGRHAFVRLILLRENFDLYPPETQEYFKMLPACPS